MKRILLAALLLAGCNVEPTKPPEKARLDHTATSWTFDSNAWTVAKASCIQCHQSSPYPAGIEIHPIMGGGQMVSNSLTLQQAFDGVAYEKAPAHKRLLTPDKSWFTNWMADQGANWHNPSVPSTLSWSMDTQISGVSNGTHAGSAGLFFGFRVEDLARLDPAYFKVNTYTDRNNVTKKGIEFAEYVGVDQDSFASSDNPTAYIFVDGLAFNGRIREFTIQGYFTQSRWPFVGVHTVEMKKGTSPYGSREKREYVRAQLDRDWLSIRSKKIPADNTETYPWSGSDPFLTATSGEALNDDMGSGLFDDAWYHFVFTGTDLGSTFRYTCLVETVGGTDIAYVSGDRSDTGSPHGGFFFGGYSTNAANKRDRFAEVTVEATLYGAGQESCRDCFYVCEECQP